MLRELNQHQLALDSYNQAIAVQPDYVECHYNRGLLRFELKQWSAALGDFTLVIDRLPNFAEGYFNRGKVLVELRQTQPALKDFNKVIALTPDHPGALHSRANLLFHLRNFAAAIASYDRAIELEPDRVEALVGRGLCLQNLRQFESAIASFNQALRWNPDRRYLLGMRRHVQMQICDWEEWEGDLELLAGGLLQHRAISPPHALLALIDSPHLHRLAAAAWVREECPPDATLGPPEPRRRGDKIRIGYFSADFRDHPVSLLTAEMFEMHDRSKFDVTAFSFGPGAGDPIRPRLEKAFDRFIDVTDRSDVEVAAAARAMGIDIAIDLSGFTENARTGIFALRAAPLQVSYLGYPGSMGAEYIDYLIGDLTVVPEALQEHYAEKIVHLPNSYLPNDSTRSISAIVHTRETVGLPAAGFVFCCFNNSYKINPDIFGIWMRVLKRADNSVLWLSRNNAVAERNLRREATRSGVDPDRLVFADRLISLPEHLARYRLADLFLDTLPYNAHATAVDALWAGLPVLTRAGASFASRAGASLVRALELPELATATPQEYEDLAVRLAAEPALMIELTAKLARKRGVAPLFDTASFTRNLESAYSQIYENHLAGKSPDHVHPTGTKA